MTITPEVLHDLVEKSGVILSFDKPLDISSFGVIAKFRRALGIKKIGHAGTLDPLATGLLVVAIGRKATRSIDSFQAEDKTYTGQITFGLSSATDDAEGPLVLQKELPDLELSLLRDATQSFIGTVKQYPPRYSARKVGGKRMYSLARKNIDFQPKQSIVDIFSFDILSLDKVVANKLEQMVGASMVYRANFEVKCGKGTYIRSLARDLGKEIGCLAYLSSLRRTVNGTFRVENAVNDKFLNEIIESSEFRISNADLGK